MEKGLAGTSNPSMRRASSRTSCEDASLLTTGTAAVTSRELASVAAAVANNSGQPPWPVTSSPAPSHAAAPWAVVAPSSATPACAPGSPSPAMDVHVCAVGLACTPGKPGPAVDAPACAPGRPGLAMVAHAGSPVHAPGATPGGTPAAASRATGGRLAKRPAKRTASRLGRARTGHHQCRPWPHLGEHQ